MKWNYAVTFFKWSFSFFFILFGLMFFFLDIFSFYILIPVLSPSPLPTSPLFLHPTFSSTLRESKASHGESAKSDTSTRGRNKVSSLPYLGWTRYPLTKKNGLQNASSNTSDKSLSHYQWPHRLSQPHNCHPHLESLVWYYLFLSKSSF